MTLPRRSHKILKSLLDRNHSKSCSNQCSITTKNYFDLKISSRYQNKRHGSAVFRFRKCCPQRRRNCTIRLKKCRISIATLFTSTAALARRTRRTSIRTCNSNPKLLPIRRMTGTFMRPCSFSAPRYFRMLSKRRRYQNLKRKSTDFSVQMLSISHNAFTSMSKRRESIHSCATQLARSSLMS